jgi:uncharacterized membrane protein
MSWETGAYAYLLVAFALFLRGAVMARRRPDMVARLHSPLHVAAFVILTLLWVVTIPLSVLLDHESEKEQEEES